MGVGEPLRAGVVKIGEGAFLEFLGCHLVSGYRALGIAGDRFIHPFYPFRRIEPAVTEFDQLPCGFGNGDGTWVVR